MYPEKHYQKLDKAHLLKIIQKHPLATVVSRIHGKNHFCFIPLVYDNKHQVLLGHVMKSNPMSVALSQKDSFFQLIFNGSDCYISPNFFHLQKIPTWHYAKVCVEVRGHLVLDYSEQYNDMKNFIAFFEKDFETPWTMDTMEERAIKNLFAELVFFRLEIKSMIGYFKLNQHKSNTFKRELKGLLRDAHQVEDANLIEVED